MKKIILITQVIFLISLNSIAQLPNYLPTSGLVGWWPFSGSANDISGNGNNGVNYGATLTADRNNTPNSAYQFNGISNYIQVANNSSLNLQNSLSISLWYSTLNLNTYQRLVDKTTQGSSDSWLLDHYQTNQVRLITANVNSLSIQPFTTIDTWVHLVVTYDGSNVKFYKNGVLVNVIPVVGINGLNTNPVRFGTNSNISSYFLNGKMDDVGIWNRALTQTEVSGLFNGCSIQNTVINASGNTTFCQGGNVQINSNKIGPAFKYQWRQNGNAIIGAISSSYSAAQSGNYTVDIDSFDCKGKSNSILVTVNSVPNVTFSSIPDFSNINQNPILLNGNPIGGVYTGSGISGNYFYPTLAGLGSKKVTYTYTDLNTCFGVVNLNTIVYDTIKTSCYDTLKINVVLTSLNPPLNLNQIKVYPNPTNSSIFIENSNFGIMNGYSIKILNSLSQIVYQTPINQPSFMVNLSTLSGKGIYYINVIDNIGNVIETRKIVLL